MSRRTPARHTVVGWREWVLLPDLSPIPVKAKVDTGARTSALHAFGLRLVEAEGVTRAEFEHQPVQRSRHGRTHCSLPVIGYRKVRSSSGQSERRPVVRTRLVIGDEEYDIDLTLTARDDMGFRMLLGRAATRGRFTVDPGRSFLHQLVTPDDRSSS